MFITSAELVKMLILYSVIGVIHAIFRKRFFALSFEGSGGYFWEFLFFLSFALVLLSSVSTAGVLLVFTFLVIPSLFGRLYTREPFKVLLIRVEVGIGASLFGLTLSYRMDLPTAPLIVASLSMVFFLLLLLKAWRAR